VHADLAVKERAIQLSIAEPMNKKAASQHACPFHNISEDKVGTAVRIVPFECNVQRLRMPCLLLRARSAQGQES